MYIDLEKAHGTWPREELRIIMYVEVRSGREECERHGILDMYERRQFNDDEVCSRNK